MVFGLGLNPSKVGKSLSAVSTRAVKDSQNKVLPKLNRIKLNNDTYRYLRQTGSAFNTKLLQLVVATRRDQRPTRFVFIVPKKLDKRTTRRNRTRRLLSRSVYWLLPRVKNGYEVVMIAKKVSEEQKLDDIKASVEEILKKAKII